MKDQYVGDIGDFGKYGILRAMCGLGMQEPSLRLAVIWYRVADDNGNDGNRIHYLNENARNDVLFKSCDSPLYDALRAIVRRNDRNVVAVETAGVLPKNTIYHRAFLDASSRADYMAAAIAGIEQADRQQNVDVLFLDPDNGLREDGKRTKDLAKYALYSDVKRFWQLGKSLVIYQHFCRKGSHRQQVQRRIEDLKSELKLSSGCAPLVFRWKTVQPRAFIVVPTEQLRDTLVARREGHISSTWGIHFGW